MKILYLSKSRIEYSVNAVYIKGLEQNGVNVTCFYASRKWMRSYFEAINFLKKEGQGSDIVVVGYDSPGFVVLARLFGKKKVVYNALCSVYERLIVSRNLAPRFSLRAFYYWLLDFFAVRSANLVMLESKSQMDYFKKLFLVPDKKLFRAWTGVDEDRFYLDPAIKKNDIFTVIFRGVLMPEAGGEFVVRAAKILENQPIQFIMAGDGMELNKVKNLIAELKPQNLKLITDFLSYDKLRIMMQKSHLSLGQLSNHERLERTIPHKCYESLVMGLPYLTASNTGILELLTPDETCLICNPADAKSLAEEILWAKNHPREIEMIAENGYQLYQTKLKSNILARNLLDRISAI